MIFGACIHRLTGKLRGVWKGTCVIYKTLASLNLAAKVDPDRFSPNVLIK